MKTFRLTLLAFGLSLLGTAAFGATYSVFDIKNPNGIYGYSNYKFLSAQGTYSGIWDLDNDSSFNSTSLTGSEITSITLDFWFADDGDADTKTVTHKSGYYKQVQVPVYDSRGRIKGYKNQSVWVDTSTTSVVEADTEYVKITAGGNTGGTNTVRSSREVDGKVYIGSPSSSYYFNTVLNNPNYYAHITYTFTAASSIFNSLVTDLQDGVLKYVVKALKGDTYLKESRITITTKAVSVPEGGATIALLGGALAALAAVRRKLRA